MEGWEANECKSNFPENEFRSAKTFLLIKLSIDKSI